MILVVNTGLCNQLPGQNRVQNDLLCVKCNIKLPSFISDVTVYC